MLLKNIFSQHHLPSASNSQNNPFLIRLPEDKWKSLVRTARISPQKRRGEPVPQQLLDRVLAAYAFWSQLQAQAQVKVAV